MSPEERDHAVDDMIELVAAVDGPRATVSTGPHKWQVLKRGACYYSRRPPNRRESYLRSPR